MEDDYDNSATEEDEEVEDEDDGYDDSALEDDCSISILSASFFFICLYLTHTPSLYYY